MRAAELLAGLVDGWPVPLRDDPPLHEITVDLDEVRPGVLFIARRAFWGDTHAQLAEAARRGAAALVISRPEAADPSLKVPTALVAREDPFLGQLAARFYGHPTRQLEVVGVTGTNGKTSTTWLVAGLWAALGRRPARMGTLGYCFHDQTLPAPNTTPDALVIQRFARDALAAGADRLVLEVSSHGLALERVAEVAFDAVGFTSLGRDHLDFHGSEAAYRQAKARLFSAHLAAAQAAGKTPRATAWIDDPWGEWMLGHAPPGVPRLGVGQGPAARLRVRETTPEGLAGSRFVLEAGGLRQPCQIQLPGDHDVANAALALALVAGDDPQALQAAAAALPTLAPVPGRLEPVGACAWIDYAHTPDAVASVIEAVGRRAPGRRLHVVLGCGGDRDRGKRPAMARAAEAAHQIWLTADNPRSEPVEAILDEMTAGLRRPALQEPDRARAIAGALSAATTEGGLCLILGKGHELTQQIGEVRWRFDDREVARRVTRALAAGVAPDRALWAWGLLGEVSAPAVLAAARAAPGGLWVLGGPPDAVALDARLPGAWLTCPFAALPERLAVHHRAVVLTDWPAGLVLDGTATPPPGAPPAPGPGGLPRIPSLRPRPT